MLTFVGLGLWDERSVTVEGKEVLRDADQVFAECYTSRLFGTSLAEFETYHDVSVEIRDRAGVERRPDPLLEAAEDGDAVFLTAGDTMNATTHVDLRLRAYDRGIQTRVVQGTTAETAASSLTGLQNYRFGKATTLPFPRPDSEQVPESVQDVLDENRDRGLHTLVYLDIDQERDTYMTVDQAAKLLAESYDDCLGVAVCRAGSPDSVIAGNRLSALAACEFGDPLHLLVIPGDLHHIEGDALRKLADTPNELIENF